MPYGAKYAYQIFGKLVVSLGLVRSYTTDHIMTLILY